MKFLFITLLLGVLLSRETSVLNQDSPRFNKKDRHLNHQNNKAGSPIVNNDIEKESKSVEKNIAKADKIEETSVAETKEIQEKQKKSDEKLEKTIEEQEKAEEKADEEQEKEIKADQEKNEKEEKALEDKLKAEEKKVMEEYQKKLEEEEKKVKEAEEAKAKEEKDDFKKKKDELDKKQKELEKNGQTDENEINYPVSWDHFKYKAQLSKGEEEFVFRTVDKNKNSILDAGEWGEFFSLFISPFEKSCNPDDKYRISAGGLALCLDEKHFKVFRQIYTKPAELADDLVNTLHLNHKINFADYLLIRRGQKAWEKCAVTGGITAKYFGCALQIAVPGDVYQNQLELNNLFTLAQLLDSGRLPLFSLTIDPVSFIDFAKHYYQFHVFSAPFYNGQVTVDQWKNGLTEGIFPFILDNYQSIKILDEIDNTVFSCSAFIAVAHTLKLGFQFSGDGKGYLSKKEFVKLFLDENFDREAKRRLGWIKIPTRKRVEYDSKNNAVVNLSEDSFMMNFLQKKYHSKKRGDTFNNANHIIEKTYDILNWNENGKLDIAQLLVFRKASWFFQSADPFFQGVLTGLKIKKGYDSYYPHIQFNDIETKSLNEAASLLSKSMMLDFKQFLAFFTYKRFFFYYTIANTINQCSTESFKHVLHKLHIVHIESGAAAGEVHYANNKKVTVNFVDGFIKAISDEANSTKEYVLSGRHDFSKDEILDKDMKIKK